MIGEPGLSDIDARFWVFTTKGDNLERVNSLVILPCDHMAFMRDIVGGAIFRKVLAAGVMGLGFALALEGAWAQDAFELSYGFSLTTDPTEEDADPQRGRLPVLEGYVTGQRGLFFVGAWVSTPLGLGHRDALELDLYGGITAEVGDLAVSLYYTRFYYGDGGDCCGEFAVDLAYPVDDDVSVAFAYSIDPEDGASFTEVGTSVGFGDFWEIGGTIGSDFGSGGDGAEYEWELGLKRSFGESWWAVVRYEDSSYESGVMILSVGADF